MDFPGNAFSPRSRLPGDENVVAPSRSAGNLPQNNLHARGRRQCFKLVGGVHRRVGSDSTPSLLPSGANSPVFSYLTYIFDLLLAARLAADPHETSHLSM